MREIKVQEITAAVSKLCKDSCYYLPEELLEKLKASIATEESRNRTGSTFCRRRSLRGGQRRYRRWLCWRLSA